MEPRKGKRYGSELRRQAVERMNACGNIVGLARELGVSRECSISGPPEWSFWGAKSRFPDWLETLVVRMKEQSCWSRVSYAQGRRATRLRYAPILHTSPRA